MNHHHQEGCRIPAVATHLAVGDILCPGDLSFLAPLPFADFWCRKRRMLGLGLGLELGHAIDLHDGSCWMLKSYGFMLPFPSVPYSYISWLGMLCDFHASSFMLKLHHSAFVPHTSCPHAMPRKSAEHCYRCRINTYDFYTSYTYTG